jgi:hypothetical protein
MRLKHTEGFLASILLRDRHAAMPKATPMTTLPIERQSALSWHADSDVTPNPADVLAMAEVLEGQHGVLAVEVAEFFSTLHSLRGDAGRCWAWAGVAETLRLRSNARATQH